MAKSERESKRTTETDAITAAEPLAPAAETTLTQGSEIGGDLSAMTVEAETIKASLSAGAAPARRMRLHGPRTPGGSRSPQQPGATPDRSTIPGHELDRAPKVTSVRRPLTEYGTSQEIMAVYRKPDIDPADPSRFEQAPPSFEEIRKVDPSQGTPIRPRPGLPADVAASLPGGQPAGRSLAEVIAERSES